MRFSWLLKSVNLVAILIFWVFAKPALAQVPPFEGYTLYSPNNSNYSYLIDMDGTVAHYWYHIRRGGYSVYLLENGNLVRPASPAMTFLNGGGSAGLVQEIEQNGDVVWEFEYNTPDYLTHHDIQPMPNGNALLIAWEVKTAAEAVAAGRNINSPMWPDHIIEVQPNGAGGAEIIWEWHVWDHLIQDHDPTKLNYGVVENHPELIDINMDIGWSGGPGGYDWLHLNSIDFNSDLDQIVVSSHFSDEFYVIDHSTTMEQAASHSGGNSGMGGDILYRWGSPSNYGAIGNEFFDVIHCAIWIPASYPGEGDFLVFHNNEGGHVSQIVQLTAPVDSSGHYQIEPGNAFEPQNPTWIYSAGYSFYSNHLGSCQRLPNGNTLICESTTGDIFEVDSLSNVVWQYNTSYEISRCLRYATDYPGLEGIVPNRVEAKSSCTPAFSLNIHPNPFNSSVIIHYELNEPGWALLDIYNIQGQLVRSLVDEYQQSGHFSVKWDGVDNSGAHAGSGIYFCRLISGQRIEIRKVLLIQ